MNIKYENNSLLHFSVLLDNAL